MKAKKKNKSYKVKNLSPGTMAYRGKKQTTAISLDIINYSGDAYKREHSSNVEDAFHHKGTNQVTWININGLNNIKEIETIGLHYELHPLTLEDIVNTHQRPKIDEFENYLYIVFKMMYFKDDDELTKEHVSMIVGKDYIITFQEADGDVFDDLRDRINSTKGRIRMRGADYLMYAVLDAIVDNYFSVIEAFGDKIEELESHIFKSSTSSDDTPNKIQALKQEVLKIRRAIFPLREVINKLDKTDANFLEAKTHDYLKDLHDHIIQVCESIDLYREMVWSLMDMYMTIINNKMNEVMKVLTIMASIFIPLTFIAGIYGMNFDHMPELHTQNGYYILLGAMAVIFILMLFYFRRKKWL